MAPVAAAIVAGLAYLGALRCGFVVDDVHQIVENDWVRSFGYLREVFSSGVWDFEGRASSYYRPLMYVWYMGIHAVAGQAPWAFHLGNILLHMAVVAMVTLTSARLMAAPPAGRALGGPLVAGLIFALHPIHVEPVAWVAGAPDLGFSLCALAALLLWMGAGPEDWWKVGGASLCVLAAMLFKEPGITTPVLLMAYDLLLRRHEVTARRMALRHAAIACAVVAYVGLRVNALSSFAPTSQNALGAVTWLASAISLAGDYLGALLFPVGLSFWHVFTPPASPLEAKVIGTAMILGAAGVGVVILARRSRPAAFAAALLVLPLAPAFHLGALNQGLENAFAERYLYLPSAGLALLVALGYEAVVGRGARPRRMATAMLALVLAWSGTATVLRVPVWRDHLTLWSDAVQKAPGSAVARANYGFALLGRGRVAEGQRELRAAAELRPELADRELGKAAAYMNRGLTQKAVFAFHAALALRPDLPEARFGLGVAYDGLGWADAAAKEYAAAITLAPDHADAHNNLGIVFAQQGKLEQAIPHFETATRLRPGDVSFRENLARAKSVAPTP